MAAEVSVAGLAGKAPRLFGKARVFLRDRRVSPVQLSELAGVVGTLEAIDGARRNARNFFDQSLIDPTENAVAQAVWAANERVLPDFSAARFSQLNPAEADAWQARAEMDWHGTIVACHRWSEQEPFSAVPFAMGSFIASMIGDYEQTKLFCEAGLTANPKNYDLRNNRAVACFFLGELEEALLQMRQLADVRKTAQQNAVWLATSGLALFHIGKFAEGREAYKSAIELALQAGARDTAVYAAAFWVKAEIAAKSDTAESLAAFEQYSRGGNSPELQYFRDLFAANARDEQPLANPT